MEQIRKGDSLRAVNFRSVIHAAQFGPAFLGDRDSAVGKSEDQDGSVIPPRFMALYGVVHWRVNRVDRRAAKNPAEEFNRVAAHVHCHPAAATVHIPKMWSVWAIMLL